MTCRLRRSLKVLKLLLRAYFWSYSRMVSEMATVLDFVGLPKSELSTDRASWALDTKLGHTILNSRRCYRRSNSYWSGTEFWPGGLVSSQQQKMSGNLSAFGDIWSLRNFGISSSYCPPLLPACLVRLLVINKTGADEWDWLKGAAARARPQSVLELGIPRMGTRARRSSWGEFKLHLHHKVWQRKLQ